MRAFTLEAETLAAVYRLTDATAIVRQPIEREVAR